MTTILDDAIPFYFERNILERIWNQCKEINKIKKVDLTRNKDRNPVKIMFLGLRAQYAVNTVMGDPYDWSVHEGNDRGVDGEVHGKTYQVKYTKHVHDPYLKFDNEQPFIADLAILTVPLTEERDDMNVRIVGYIEADLFFNLCVTMTWGGYTGDKCVRYTQLKPFIYLLREKRRKVPHQNWKQNSLFPRRNYGY